MQIYLPPSHFWGHPSPPILPTKKRSSWSTPPNFYLNTINDVINDIFDLKVCGLNKRF